MDSGVPTPSGSTGGLAKTAAAVGTAAAVAATSHIASLDSTLPQVNFVCTVDIVLFALASSRVLMPEFGAKSTKANDHVCSKRESTGGSTVTAHGDKSVCSVVVVLG